MLWMTASLLVCSAESRHLQPTLQDSYIQSPAAKDAYRLEKDYNRQLNNKEEAVISGGAEVCQLTQPDDSKHYISTTFFYQHVCLLTDESKTVTNIYSLCLRYNRAKYVIVLNSQQLTALNYDIYSHQASYVSHQSSQYTNGKYNFVECNRYSEYPGAWRRNYYLKYTVSKDVDTQVYQLYKGDTVVQSKP